MSWQEYVDVSLLGTKNVSKASIHGMDGGVWAHSSPFKPEPYEIKAIVDEMNKASPAGFYGSGIVVDTVKYTFVQKKGDTLYGRRGQESGVVIALTQKAAIVAVYEGGIQPGACQSVVEKLAIFLKDQGC